MRHLADPFAVLGPHGGVVRAFLPHARQMEAVTPGGPIPLTRDSQGVFEGRVTGPYRLRADGLEFEDPYRFGPTLGPLDDHLMVEGTHHALATCLGAHAVTHEGCAGVRFAVWAPNARRVSVVGGWNGWDGRIHPMRKRLDSGLWEIFLPALAPGAAYKYEIEGPDGLLPLKADPCGQASELRPATASVVPLPAVFDWGDDAPRPARRKDAVSIYEVHAPSWRRHPDGRMYDWDELAASLIPHVRWLGFTHIELLPVMEHPLDASWGYQPIGLFAPTARLGDGAGLRRFMRAAHAAGIGVILDWVPAHFPRDAHGLAHFDGTALYEYSDPRRGSHAGWGTALFDCGRREVTGFLAANALHWLREFRADGLRVDAVSTLVHLDHGRAPGEWAPNAEGGTTNHEAVAFLKRLNALVAERCPDAAMMAEEATAWPGVTDPKGLGFRFKWNMGWMNDILRYVALDPIHRRFQHGLVTFGLMYAFDEAFVLPLSHDEVVHGKGSLLGRLPGDDAQRFAMLRALYGFMWGHPGKKLLFMGGEFAQWREWSEERELDWGLLQHAPHQAVQEVVRACNRLYRALPALHDDTSAGFRWIEADDAALSVFAWLRGDQLAVVSNFTPVARDRYRIGLPRPGWWRVVLDTDALGRETRMLAEDVPCHGFPCSATLALPPLSTLWLVPEGAELDA